ncbi:Hypothetical protein POVR1_LOCUS79 [uncultured virus]|nr:Hypothetical protein POVR1_LOCUS79 [uncultured virus]
MSSLRIYSSHCDGTITIHQPFRQLWLILRAVGKYVTPPNIPPLIYPVQTMTFHGTSCEDGMCLFDENKAELVMKDYQCTYKVSWKTSPPSPISFYSPIRQYSNDRLYLNVDDKNRLSSYDESTHHCVMKFVRLVVKTQPGTCIHLKVQPIFAETNLQPPIHLRYCYEGIAHKVRVFDVVRHGAFYELVPHGAFKKLCKLVKKTYEIRSIQEPIYQPLTCNLQIFPPTTYHHILSKESFQCIFTVTTQILPKRDRRGYYGIVIRKSSDMSTAARVDYKFQLSQEIITTPDVIVTAVYFDSNQYSEHKVGTQVVSKTHLGPYPNGKLVILEGTLHLESTAVDVALLISNSLYGLLPENGEEPDNIVKFLEVTISYENVRR